MFKVKQEGKCSWDIGGKEGIEKGEGREAARDLIL